MIDQILTLLTRQAVERLNTSAAQIATELQQAEEGTLTVSLSLKLSLLHNKVGCASGLSFARKFKNKGQDIIELPGVDDGQLELMEAGE